MNTILIQDTLFCLQQINSRVPSNFVLFNYGDANLIKEKIELVSKDIEKEFPYFNKRLNSLLDTLFIVNNLDGSLGMNTYIFGQIYEILIYLVHAHYLDQWSLIHPRISKVSKALYLDGHYANAAVDAFIEINERVKGLFQILRPNDKVPDGDTAMTTVFSPNAPLVKFGDNSSESGKNIQKGFMQMLSGAMSALRNPKAHANITISADDAMRRLMLASMLMFKIDEAVAYSNIKEP